jgi:hypothetical protein
LIEAVTAAIVLVPIGLCLLDLIVLVIADSMNDTAAKNAARAAANMPDFNSALAAAKQSLTATQNSSIVTSLSIATLDYPDANDSVTCQTIMQVRLPVPFPGISSITFKAKDSEPILVKETP